jgi:2-polyprenyl-6-methoxyphenol hydroxylase-like FAD-dependent oxidoreductase
LARFRFRFAGGVKRRIEQRNLKSVVRVLISGAGIAGPTLAYWLTHYGFQPTLVEQAPQLRTGGYMIDFWGLGFEIADRMELLPYLRSKGYAVREVRVVNEAGKRVAGFSTQAFARITRNRYLSLPRGDLAASIYHKVERNVEAIFGDSVTHLEQTQDHVRVRFEHGRPREFDLVVGADGLHSRVRELAFGPQSRFEKYLGYKVAAFDVTGYAPRDELVYVMYTEVGQQAARFAMRDDRTMFLFIFVDDDPKAGFPANSSKPKDLLRERFGHSGWECARILESLDDATSLYFDRVSQIQMDVHKGLWTHGRVALVGDAAFCVSFLAGQGSALAMAASYILAGELYKAGGDHVRAFARYQKVFAPLVGMKQKSALRFAGFFAPKSAGALFLRNQMIKWFEVPLVADIAFSQDLKDNLAIPEF